jgi:hypothetical protein
VDDQADRDEPEDSGGSSRPGKLAVGLALIAGALAAVVILIAYSPDSDTPKQPSGERLPATLGAVPTNRVEGRGKATLRLEGRVATVTLEANGLLDDAHVMHIHAGERGTCPTPAAARPHNGNLSISTLDGAAFYGSPRISLTKGGDTGVVSILEFARYPSTGGFIYKRAIELRPRTIRFLRRNLASIVVHGIDYNGNGVYDQTLGASDLNPGLQGEATAPALCGELAADRASGQSARRPSAAGQIYTSALALPPTAPSVICHLRRTT